MYYTDPNEIWRHHLNPRDDMSDDERMAVSILHVVVIFIMLMAGLLLCALFGSCTTERVVTVEKVRTDTLWQNHTKHDSIWMHDSIHIKEKGDTVWIERWHNKWENHLKHDTVYQSRADSVPIPYPVVKEVPAKMSQCQKWLMWIGLATVLGVIIFVVIKLKRFLPWI